MSRDPKAPRKEPPAAERAASVGRGRRKARTGARRAARSEWSRGLGRLGFLAKGLVYAVVALIAIEVARGEKKKAEGRGPALLGVVAAGLLTYALYSLIEARYCQL